MNASERIKELKEEIWQKQTERVGSIQLHKSLNRVPYPMIFMRSNPEEKDDSLKQSWE